MTCLPKTAATRRYLIRFAIAMAAYILLIALDGVCFRMYHPTGALAYGLAILPALAIIGQIVIVGIYLAEEKDEFQRNLFVQVLLWGLGGVLAFTSVWGMLESFTHIRHFEPTWTFSVFWFFVGVSTPFLQRKYR
jgi:hypothetical protein